jgi:CheY-like chemotaxis protein
MTPPIILVVEDDPVLRYLTTMQISVLGYEAETVDCGEAAVEKELAGIALIFMDMGLPGIDGCDATLLIRKKELNEKRTRVPIIALTAHSDRQRCLLAGMDDFLQKPALIADIKSMLEKWLPHSTKQP